MTLDVIVLQQNGKKIVVEYTGTHENLTIKRKVLVDLATTANLAITQEAIKLAVKDDFRQHWLVGLTFSMEVKEIGVQEELQHK